MGSAPDQATAPSAPTLLIVEVTRRQAEQLAVIANGKGIDMAIVRYVLRPRNQYGKGYLDSGPDTPYQTAPNDSPVTPQSLQTLFHAEPGVGPAPTPALAPT